MVVGFAGFADIRAEVVTAKPCGRDLTLAPGRKRRGVHDLERKLEGVHERTNVGFLAEISRIDMQRRARIAAR
jgi:hypothetical protein